MIGVWLRYVTGVRRSWRSWTVLAVLCGLTLSLALAAAADARRTSTALERYLSTYHSPDAAVAMDQTLYSPELVSQLFDQVDRLPQVSVAAHVRGVFLEVMDEQGQFVKAFDFGSAVGKLVDEAAIHEVGTFQLFGGRYPAPDRPDEVMVNREAIAAGGWSIGDQLDSIRLFRRSDFDEEGNADLTKGEPLQVTIVGVAQRPDELLDDTGGRVPQVYLFPAFARAHDAFGFYLIDYVRLRNGAADEAAFQKDAAAISSGTEQDPLQYSSFTDATRHSDQALRPQVVAIWLLAAVLLIAAMYFTAQSMARSLRTHYADLAALRALGMSRRSIALAITMHAASITVVAAVVAAVGCWASSIVTPFGATSDVEPDPGLYLDVSVMAVGAAIIIVAVSTMLLIWSWRLAGRIGQPWGSDSRAATVASIGSVGLVGRLRTGVLTTTAARFAFQSSSDRNSAAVHGVTGSAALGIALFAGGLAFASSIQTVLETPAAHGWNWDVAIVNNFGAIPDDAVEFVTNDDHVDELTAFTTGMLTIAGHRVFSLGIDQKLGAVYLSLTDGRPPQSADEIVLGASTLRATGRSMGDTIDVVTPNDTREMTIVGLATFPPIGSARFGSLSLGDGAATIASVLPTTDPSGTYSGALVRVRDGSRATDVAALRVIIAGLGCTDSGCFLTDAQPPQLAGYAELRSIWVPFGLALGSLVAVPLGYGVISSVRARRRELSILRAMGMSQRQVSAVVILQGLSIVTVSAIAGVVLGVVAAGVAWGVFSRSVGVHWPLGVPKLAFALIVAGALVIALLISMVVAVSPSARRAESLQ
ncbi:MAG: FtsX-like permease family protein [Ilumatobacteraceae bacterium]|nr:FtsX-like permease family protein [Ilumatobacteraceae bacterium]